jgi:outer membrane receptor protein involved in Fe transport
VYITADAYINQLRNFVTDLLPGVNPTYQSYALTDEVNVPDELVALDARLELLGLPANHPLRAPIPLLIGGHAQLQQGTRIQGGNALATLPDGSRAIVLSYTNAGKVTERGIELGVGYQFTPEIRGDVSFTGFSFDVDESEQAAGDQLVPNTPSKKATFSLSYAGQQGFDGNVTLRLVDGHPWAAGIFQGYVPANELLNVSAGYRINNYVRIHAAATNLLDQQRFQLFGGSVIERRVLGGVTANF